MIYGDVTTVPRYGKPLAISHVVIITFSSDTRGEKSPQKIKKRDGKKKLTFSGSGNIPSNPQLLIAGPLELSSEQYTLCAAISQLTHENKPSE